jgi:hypothetical protein
MSNDDDFKAKIYYALVMRITPEQRQVILNFLENQGVRVCFQTTDFSPLRVVRTGSPERFMEAKS